MHRKEAMKHINTAQALGAARGWDMLDKLLYLVDSVAAAERKACAQVCVPYVESLNDAVALTALNIHDAICERAKHE